MGKAVEKGKKKKGRPSLLDLQKRNLKQQQEEEQRKQQSQQQLQLRRSQKVQNPNPNNTPTPIRRSTRRNPSLDPSSPTADDDEASAEDEEDDKSTGKRRREKKLKLVHKLPDSSANSGSLNSGSDSNPEDDSTDAASHKKRRIEAIGDRSGQRKDDKVGVKEEGSTHPTSAKQETEVDDGPSTPLPDKKLLLFILDRLQKKDRYAVFAEPVDPEELPDYHEIIENPMDFSTIRKKLEEGAYSTLEQFERDVFLLCSNAMQYNAPDTIYFRQARTIQELAKKNFENLRQDSDHNEPEMKIVRRGRPPTKNLKKPMDRPSQEVATSDCPATILDSGRENISQPNYDIRKTNNCLGKFASPDSLGRMNYGSRQGEVYISWSAEKYDRADDILGSMSRGISMKHGKKQIVLDENRRNSYRISWSSTDRQDPTSALTTFRGEQKHLIPVGLHTEYGYARSLARFAAKLGPVAWKVACKKLEKCLPAGVKFGPGWVGENEASSPPSVPRSSSSAPSLPMPDCNGSKSSEATPPSEKQASSSQSPMDSLSTKATPPSISGNATTVSSPPIPKSSHSGTEEAVQPAFNTLNSSNMAAAGPGSALQVHQQPMLQPGINGINGTHGFNFPTQIGKLARSGRQSSTRPNSPSMGNNNFPSASSEDRLFGANRENSITRKSVDCLPSSGAQQKPARAGSAPPDLNEGFQSPSSPSRRAESGQPDLALQLG